MSRDVMLTTTDNPYDPFDDFDKWLSYDIEKGYNTCGLLALISKSSSELSDSMQVDEIEESIDNFIELDPLNRFVKVIRK